MLVNSGTGILSRSTYSEYMYSCNDVDDIDKTTNVAVHATIFTGQLIFVRNCRSMLADFNFACVI